MTTTGTVSYSSNNSGGGWWLSNDDWTALEEAGWKVDWFKDSEYYGKYVQDDGMWLGGLASSATLEDTTLADAISDWESITGQSSNALGCSCCGTPHSFSFEGDDGSSEYYSPDYPTYGDRY